MSLIAARLNLTERCTIERKESGTDGWGGAAGDWQEHLADQPCRVWASTGEERIVDGSTVTPLENVHLLLPLGTDVTTRDRVASVTVRGGTAQAGPLGIRAVMTHKDHIECLLVKVG